MSSTGIYLVTKHIRHYRRLALSPHNLEAASTFLSNQEEEPATVDTSAPVVTVIIKGSEVLGTIIDGGSDVNVIS